MRLPSIVPRQIVMPLVVLVCGALVIYPIAFIPQRFRPFVALNPLSGIFEGFRSILFGGSRLDPVLTSISLTTSVIVLVVGFIYFRRAERHFADII